jgi:hypothetical protein
MTFVLGLFNSLIPVQKKVVAYETRRILPNLSPAERAELANDLRVLSQPAPAQGPDRKNFYNPLQQSIVPVGAP